ncbi:hypothetical protein SETIT_8G030900v2 [Setaria italica]|uniref:Uncharacterized protein n=1 Tax=Setaria italica TaxID=4555 RepID=A0A368S3X7_SETIT|nr:hypothetical protein SETIT_8G030900v2 [Setaria italica]
MEGKRTTALMVIMCLVILSLNVNPATAAQCDCCKSDQAKQLCSTCTSTGAPDIFCESASYRGPIRMHMLLCFKLWPSYINVYLQ